MFEPQTEDATDHQDQDEGLQGQQELTQEEVVVYAPEVRDAAEGQKDSNKDKGTNVFHMNYDKMTQLISKFCLAVCINMCA